MSDKEKHYKDLDHTSIMAFLSRPKQNRYKRVRREIHPSSSSGDEETKTVHRKLSQRGDISDNDNLVAEV